MVAAHQLVVADKECLDPGFVIPLGQGDDVHVLDGIGVDLYPLLLGNPFDASNPVPEHGGALEFQTLRRKLHVLLQVLGNCVGVPLHKQDDLLDHPVVLLPGGVAGAGGDAPVDVVLQARARVISRDYLGAGAVREQLLDQVHGLAHGAGGGEGPKIAGAVLGYPARDVHPGEVFLQVYFEEGVGLVVFQPGVVPGAVTLDQRIFQDQSLGFRVRDDALEVIELGDHAPNLVGKVGGGAEVGAQPVAQDAGLTHVQDVAADVLHQIDAGTLGRYP